MGYPMAVRLLKAGHVVTVFNRHYEKAHSLKHFGATVVRHVEQAVGQADCVVLTLSDAKAIQDVLFSKKKIVLAAKTVIQMGTISPKESVELCKKVIKADGEYFECPVLGSRKEAKAGVLILMVGSTHKQFEQWEGFLKCFGLHPRWIGVVGKAAALKLALNQLIAALNSAFALSLSFVQKQGVKVEDFMEILRHSVLYAPTFDKKLLTMLHHQYARPNFSTKNMLKDVELFLKESRLHRLSTEALQGIEKVLIKAVKKGLQDDDYCSLFEIISAKK